MSKYSILSMRDTDEDFSITLMFKEYVLNTREEKRRFFFDLDSFVSNLARERDDFMNRLENIKKQSNWDDQY